MGDTIEPKSYADGAHIEKSASHTHDNALDANTKAAEYKLAAIEAENAEHDMGVLQAVKQYPMAATWAFVMSCTIVRWPIVFRRRKR